MKKLLQQPVITIVSIPKTQIEGLQNDIVHWRVVEKYIISGVIKSWMAADTPPPDKENYYCFAVGANDKMWLL